MRLGVHTPPLYDKPLDDAVAYLADLDVTAIEPGVGGHPGDVHLPPEQYLDDDDRQSDLQTLLDQHGMVLSALAAHTNPLHPEPDQAEMADHVLRRAVKLASQLDVGVVTTFSGLPAGAPEDTTPNWITAPWPGEHRKALEYQWEVAIDYWRDIVADADAHDVDIALEMHPNMLVHEPRGLIRLREATNDRLGANFDPSHLYWQGVDCLESIRFLGEYDAITHVHAKDAALYPSNVRTKGVLDADPYDDPATRSWLFRTVGYGHGESHWRDIVSTLRMVGYDGTLSIEHEDVLMSSREGLEKAIELLGRIILETEPGTAFWA